MKKISTALIVNISIVIITILAICLVNRPSDKVIVIFIGLMTGAIFTSWRMIKPALIKAFDHFELGLVHIFAYEGDWKKAWEYIGVITLSITSVACWIWILCKIYPIPPVDRNIFHSLLTLISVFCSLICTLVTIVIALTGWRKRKHISFSIEMRESLFFVAVFHPLVLIVCAIVAFCYGLWNILKKVFCRPTSAFADSLSRLVDM